MNYLVYKHTSPSGKSYIGITNNYNKRCSAHKTTAGCKAFSAAITKYGWDSFTHEILLCSLTIEEANMQEQQLILEHNTLSPNGYNLTTGGKVYQLSAETKARISAANQGKNLSEEHKQKISKALSGKQRPPGVRSKISEAHKGIKHSSESKLKMSESRTGRSHSIESKLKRSKHWLCTSPDSKTHQIINLKEFCKNHNLCDTSMKAVANGVREYYKGWKCIRLDL